MGQKNITAYAAVLAVWAAWGAPPQGKEHVNTIGMRLVRIAPGSFRMGEGNAIPDELIAPLTYPTRDELARRFPKVDPRKFRIPFEDFRHGDYDEQPVHTVRITRPFYMGAFEVTNAQYEQFDPSHRTLRGKRGFSRDDDEAVLFVSWEDATAFCDWLSKKEGLPYRLPTEAEWEYAARAGTTTVFWTGESLPAPFLKNARSTDFRSPRDIVPLRVGKTPPNPWGIFDVHGNVEEWCWDWYGPYQAGSQRDPAGRAGGDFKVTRGGSHGTDPYYLRSANRMGALPETRSWLIGFRVVLGALPATAPLPAVTKPRPSLDSRPMSKPDPDRPYFKGPRRYVKIPPGAHGPVFAHHNHDTAITECPNGDLLAIWYTCAQERGRELAVASSRLRHGAEEWEPASPFWDTPDRNDHCPALWYDGKDTIYHFNGLGVAGKWEPLAIIMRTSKDNGVTWSRARLIAPEFGFRNMLGEPVFRTSSGAIVLGADAQGGSTVWVSRDEGRTWNDGGGNIRGVHAGIVELNDGRLMALGRGQNIDGWMPQSISIDMGKTWSHRPSVLPPISGGQRAVLIRLKEGPLFFASFAEDVERFEPILDGNGRRHVSSLFGAVSFDDGKTWPVRRVISDPRAEHGAETIDGGRIRMSPNTSEPQGYTSACQARDGVIHLISSINHYAFNLAWLKQGQPKAPRLPQARALPARQALRRSGAFEDLDPAKGFTVEARVRSDQAGEELEVFASTGPLTTNHYRLRIRPAGVDYWYDGRFRELAGGFDSPGGIHTCRLAVREDTAAQIYLDGRLLGVQPADLIIDWRRPAPGSLIESRAQTLTYDLSGAYAPASVEKP